MTQTPDLADIMPTERIRRSLRPPHLPAPVMIAVAWIDDEMVDGDGNNLQIPGLAAVSGGDVPGGTKAEGAEFVLVSTSTTSFNVSTGWVGYADRVSWEANHYPVIRGTQAVLMAGRLRMQQRVDQDLAGLLPSFTSLTDRSLLALRDQDMITAKAVYDGQNPHKTAGGVVAVLHTNQVRDWALDLANNGGTQLGGDAQSQNAALIQGQGQGLVAMRHNMQIWSTPSVPTSAGDATGAIIAAGDGGALLYALREGIGWDSEWMPRSKQWEVVVAANYGFVLSDDNNGSRVVSRAA